MYIRIVNDMKKFNVERELSKLNKKRLSDKSKSNFMGMLIPFFVMGFSCVGLIAASYSLDVNEVNNEIIYDNVVQYQAFDKEKERTINDNFGISKYFTNSDDKYIYFNDMLFRIIRVNGSGSYRIMLDSNMNFDNALSIEDNLYYWFNSHFNGNRYIVNDMYDNNFVENKDIISLVTLTGKLDKVGLLSMSEYKLFYELDENVSMYLYNYDVNGNRWCSKDGVLGNCNEFDMYYLKPVINVKVSKLVGEGSRVNPYTIED